MRIPGSHGTNSEKVAKQGSWCKPCWGHFFLENVDDKESTDGYVVFTWKCIASTAEGNADATHNERLYTVGDTDEKQKSAFERALFLALKLGLVTPEEIDSGADIDFSWRPAIGKQAVLHLEERKFKGQDGTEKTRTQIAFKGVYDFNDEEVLSRPEIPLDLEMLRIAGVKLEPRKKAGEAAAAKTPTKAKTATKPKAAAAAAPSGDEDLGEI